MCLDMEDNPARSRGHTDDDLAHTWRWDIKDCALILGRKSRVQGVDSEVILPIKGGMLSDHVVQASDLAYARHKDKNGGGVLVMFVAEAYLFHQTDDEFIRDEALVEKLDAGDGTWQVRLGQLDSFP